MSFTNHTFSDSSVFTPYLSLDLERFQANVQRLNTRLADHKVVLRPHLKTVKSVPAARVLAPEDNTPVTVSTLREAEVFAAEGYREILYAVGIAPQKLTRVCHLNADAPIVTVILDSQAQAEAVIAASEEFKAVIPVMIEVDCDGHRGGLRADDPAVITIASSLVHAGIPFKGVMLHAGESYGLAVPEKLAAAAEQERATAVQAAENIRAAGIDCPVVSVGSTPTAFFAENLTGVTEVRAGVFSFFDLVMAGVGVCKPSDIALSVVTTVIGHRKDKGWIMTDSGWMALSRDRGTAKQQQDQGYGMVCNMAGEPYTDLLVADVSQEHGILAIRSGSDQPLPDLPVGTQLRVLPNHACATAAQHDQYRVESTIDGFAEIWPRIRGW